MKNFWNWLKSVVPHISIICSGMILTFVIIEMINSHAGFINHRYTRIVLIIWVISAVMSSVLLVAAQRREFRAKQDQDWPGDDEKPEKITPAPGRREKRETREPREVRESAKPKRKHLK